MLINKVPQSCCTSSGLCISYSWLSSNDTTIDADKIVDKLNMSFTGYSPPNFDDTPELHHRSEKCIWYCQKTSRTFFFPLKDEMVDAQEMHVKFLLV
ncbi:hypothetical protein OPV22_009661 [Ensete ventricosum]|uniref:Uncharacterized protein n=1 Tax=Ensete ventricosum TaxID=4639 RepID=A0AAV8RHG6_ENSVE|nr:hypothetical protein OPV22_009661 [Ensete ventricosum]